MRQSVAERIKPETQDHDVFLYVDDLVFQELIEDFAGLEHAHTYAWHKVHKEGEGAAAHICDEWGNVVEEITFQETCCGCGCGGEVSTLGGVIGGHEERAFMRGAR